MTINLTIFSENNKNIVLTRLDNFTSTNFSQNSIQNNIDYTNYLVNIKTSSNFGLNDFWNMLDDVSKDVVLISLLFVVLLLIIFGVNFIRKLGED